MYHVGTVIAKIRTEFNISDSAACRLWKGDMNDRTYELLTMTNATVPEAELYDGQVSEIANLYKILLLVSPITQLLMLEVKEDDGMWPIDKKI